MSYQPRGMLEKDSSGMYARKTIQSLARIKTIASLPVGASFSSVTESVEEGTVNAVRIQRDDFARENVNLRIQLAAAVELLRELRPESLTASLRDKVGEFLANPATARLTRRWAALEAEHLAAMTFRLAYRGNRFHDEMMKWHTALAAVAATEKP